MSIKRIMAISLRVIKQIAGDHRTVALMLLVPSLLTGLFAWMLNSSASFSSIGPRLVGLFPFIVMFLLASITTLRERQSGTLERFLTTPMRKDEFIIGYAIAFSLMAVLQSAITMNFALFVCGLELNDNYWLLLFAAIANALLGMSLGLLASAFAKSEFQVIQFMPAFVFPQIILGGLFVPVSVMPDVLQTLSEWLPLTHSLRALSYISANSSQSEILSEILVVATVCLGSLIIGSITLRKKTQ